MRADYPKETPAMKERQKYAAELTKDCPFFAPDERQKGLFTCLDAIRKRRDMGKVAVIPMQGFPAAWVNLGWLQLKADTAQKELLDKHGMSYVAKVVELIVVESVQRVKFIKAVPAQKTTRQKEIRQIDVKFRTKDDDGYYSYEFYVNLPDLKRSIKRAKK